MTQASSHIINIFYLYTPISNPEALRDYLKSEGTRLGIKGRILIAHEGINGTAEGTADALRDFESCIHAQDGTSGTYGDLSRVWFKHSPGTGVAFPKLKIKVRNEIVTLGLGKEGDINPNEVTGTHVKPEELKSWIEKGEDFVIVDMRNDYEYAVGHFKNSINPELENFRDLTTLDATKLPPKDKKVLTVCTYGVRCEKASGYLKTQGYDNVYQLDGGIGTYMKAYPGEDFLGSLYVFDGRITERFTDQYEVVGTCVSCQGKTEEYDNCAYAECHRKLVRCSLCMAKEPYYCSSDCKSAVLVTLS
jgi:UPF0176 protein